ncbi:serine/threonine protein kinase [Catenulispora sp. NF23]|uniref:serine/threonine protein kinase n=1 Tax=Catenulispora pinistramenti TaxID=2705254 RepID=UPI001BAB390E|nr:serine/threonine-protein kinase [Catenulispora pinistramenti]MBS2531344.1 serine/threonine protein kinase [Catenulispora pinistramenti]
MNGNVLRGETAATDRIGPYLLVTQLGSGAMGRVFLGTDAAGRQAAVKVVRSDLADIPAFRKRFARELQVAERVHSPRVAEIFNAQTDGRQPWLATEYVPGPTLQDAVDQGGAFDNRRLRALAVAVAQALQVIHAVEVVHRDLKPANILLGPDGPKVIDFGVARALDASLLTNTGQTLGTPAYMSPEQADGRSVESSSDVFALGALLVFAATGRLAFGDGAPLAILHRVVNNEPDLTGVAEGDEALRRVIEGCLAKEPEDRPSPEQIVQLFGVTEWQPLTGVAWQQPPLGVGLPLTASESYDLPTMSLAPRRAGRRAAVISGATAAALVLVAVAIAESSGGGKGTSADSAHTGSTAAGSQQNGGAFPPTGGSSGSGSGGQTTSSGGPSPTPGGQVAPVKPGSPGTTPAQGGSQPVTITFSESNNQNDPPSSSASHPSSHPSTKKSSAPAQPAHNPPVPMGAGEITALIPTWFGEPTMNISWKAHPDATSYKLHYTISPGVSSGLNPPPATDQTIPVDGTSYSYQFTAGGVTCLQLAAVNQYGVSAYYPSPMTCFNDGGQQTSG